jgi:hypothetical protein
MDVLKEIVEIWLVGKEYIGDGNYKLSEGGAARLRWLLSQRG